jgi:MYXO-CTERM domain-containing protein
MLFCKSGSFVRLDALHSLSLPLTGPVFNLPAGYDADAPSYGIADNVFTPVPEPGHYAAAAALGLLGFGLWRRGRRN